MRIDDSPIKVRTVFSPDQQASHVATESGLLMDSDKEMAAAAVAKLNEAIVAAVAKALDGDPSVAASQP